MASQGPFVPAFAEDLPVGTVAWSGVDNGTFQDSVLTSITFGSLQSSDYASYYDYGFSIPTGATINGIIFEVYAYTHGASHVVTAYPSKDGSAVQGVGIEMPNSGVGWNAYGSATELWGVTWTASEINSTAFSFIIQAVATSGASTTTSFDAVRVTVHYTDSSIGKSVSLPYAVAQFIPPAVPAGLFDPHLVGKAWF